MSANPLRLVIMAALLLAGSAGADERTPPNIVLVFTDDQGWADLGTQGAEGFETPHLDRLAREGARLTDFYVSAAVCSASRAALLTGCYHERVGITGALGPSSRIGLHEDEVTLAEICRQRGYATAVFGKWHLGHQEKFLPLNHGFDELIPLLIQTTCGRIIRRWRTCRWSSASDVGRICR